MLLPLPSFLNFTFLFYLLHLVLPSIEASSASWSSAIMNVNINLDDVTGTAEIQVTGFQGVTGWYGIGIGASMDTAELLVMWTNSDGSTTISLRTKAPFIMPQPSTLQSVITNLASSPSASPSSVFHYTMPQSTAEYILNSHTSRFIWAHGTNQPATNFPNSTFTHHTAFGTFELIFSTPVTTSASASTATASSTSPGSTSTALSGGLGQGNSSNSTGPNPGWEVDNPLITSYDKFILVHGLLGFLAWAFFAPISIFLARFGRHFKYWVKAHYGLQVLAVGTLTIACSVIGYLLSFGAHLMTPHQIIGLVMLVGMACQMSLGWLIHHFYKPNIRRPIRNHLHRFFGCALLILGFAQIPLGLYDYVAASYLWILYFCWLAVLAVLFVLFTLREFWKDRVREGQRVQIDVEHDFTPSAGAVNTTSVWDSQTPQDSGVDSPAERKQQ